MIRAEVFKKLLIDAGIDQNLIHIRIQENEYSPDDSHGFHITGLLRKVGSNDKW